MEWITRAKNQKRVIDICTIHERALVVPPRNVDRFSLHLICEGSALIKVEEKLIEVTAPSLICFDDAKQVEVVKTEDLTCKNIIFNPTFIHLSLTISRIRDALCTESEQDSVFRMEPFVSENKFVFHLKNEHLNYFSSCFDLVDNELKEQADWMWSCRARSFFMDMMKNLDNLYYGYYFNLAKNKGFDEFFIQIAEFVEKNLHNNITLAIACSKFSVNRNKLEAMFKENVSLSFYQYIRQKRMEHACYYLYFTELSLSEIAEYTGFSSSQNFSRFFSSVTNQTPIGYRRKAVKPSPVRISISR